MRTTGTPTGPESFASRHPRGQTGLTMLEVLVSLALIGSVFAAIVAGMLTTATTTSMVSRATVASGALSGVTERIKTMDYVPCDDHGGPDPATLSAKYLAWSNHYLPSGASFEVVSVRFWDGATFASCTSDHGAELLRIKITPDGPGPSTYGEVVVRDPSARPRG